ncbi:MAG: Nramp family divalent metal transporter [Verrucomicrobiota bacterium]|nr:Nramp family divalent metal transporter [Verrucomicrobiota bacterium]
MSQPSYQTPPKDWKGIAKQLGPGLIISANIVGSGELIVTTKVGADVGFILLWFIILGCMIKVFLQVELGRYAMTHGKTTLQAMDAVPGPRFAVILRFLNIRAEGSWLVWCWLVMFIATFFQVSGMVGGIAGVFETGVPSMSNPPAWYVEGQAGVSAPMVAERWQQLLNTGWALLITGSCALLLLIGRYRFIERFSTTMVAGFTLFTIFAVFSLYTTDYGITAKQIAEGLRFSMPDKFITAFAAFGVIGVGAAELIYYPYWCLEKGYARNVGPKDDSPEWEERAQGWMRVLKWDAWVSMVIYTGATVAFYLLGAAVLHGKGLEVTNNDLIPTLSNLYRESFGIPGLWIFLVGALVVLYSTVFISTASNARLSADLWLLFTGKSKNKEQDRSTLIKRACVLIPMLYFIFYLSVGKPLTLVFIGALAQALMLPFLCFAALYFYYFQTHRALLPGRMWLILLWISSLLMTAVGCYQLFEKLK